MTMNTEKFNKMSRSQRSSVMAMMEASQKTMTDELNKPLTQTNDELASAYLEASKRSTKTSKSEFAQMLARDRKAGVMAKASGAQDAFMFWGLNDKTWAAGQGYVLDAVEGKPEAQTPDVLKKSNLFSKLDLPRYADTNSQEHKALMTALENRRF